MILDGKKIANKRKEALRERLFKESKKPHLVIIQIGDRPDSNTYVRTKKKFGEDIYCDVSDIKLDKGISEDQALEVIDCYNNDEEVEGIILQLPIPDNLNKEKLIEKISAEKDVDGLRKGGKFIPATTKGIVTLLEEYKIPIKDQKILVIGQGDLVGKPTAKYFKKLGANVTTADIDTIDLIKETKDADIIISAVGKTELIGSEHVAPGQVVIDVGFNLVDGKVVGDVRFDEVEKIVKFITPVPGGVGPMTVVSLFENLVNG